MFLSKLFFPVLAATSIASVAFASPDARLALVAGFEKRGDVDPSVVLGAVTRLNDEVQSVTKNPSSPAVAPEGSAKSPTAVLPTNNGASTVGKIVILVDATTATLTAASPASPSGGNLDDIVAELLGVVNDLLDFLLGGGSASDAELSTTSVPASTTELDQSLKALLVVVDSKTPGFLTSISSK